MKKAIAISLLLALAPHALSDVQASDAYDQSQTGATNVDANCADMNSSLLLVKPGKPVAYELIESDPIDATASFRVRLLEAGIVDSKLNLHGIAYPDAVANVVFATSVDLKDGEDINITVKAEDILWPGTRTATVCLSTKLRYEDEEKNEKMGEILVRKSIDVVFDIRTLPRVTALQEKLELAVVRCKWRWSCSLAEAIVPELSAMDKGWAVGFRNDSLATVEATTVIRMHRSGEISPIDAATMTGNTELKIGEEAEYTLKLNSDLGPGKFEGTVALRTHPKGEDPLPGRKDKKGITRNAADTAITASVSVRAGIAVPIAMLLFGIIAGRMNRQLSTPEAQARLLLVERMYETSTRIETLNNPASKDFARRRIAKIQRDLNEPFLTNESIDEELTQIGRQIYMFGLIDDLGARSDDSAIAGLIDEARSLVRTGKLDEAEQKRKEILDALEASAAITRRSRAMLAPLGTPIAAGAEKDQPVPPVARTWADRIAGFMAWLAGTRRVSTKMLYRYFQPLATLALLIALVALGLVTFYSGAEHNTFGDSLIDDYLPLFLWGFGSDVLSKRLQDVTMSKD